MEYIYDPKARYAQAHTWVRLEGEWAVIGVTDFAQHKLGDVMSVELPRIGSVVKSGEAVAYIESVKASDEASAPIGGEVTEVNSKLEDRPELINRSPYGDAWLAKLRPSRPAEMDGLMDATAYEAFVRAAE